MRQNWKVYLTITLSTSCLNCFRYFGTLVVLINFLSCERRVNSVVIAIQSSFYYSVLSNPRSHWFCFTRATWLVRKICPTPSTNRMQNWNHSRLVRPCFRALYGEGLFLLWVLIDTCRYFPLFWLAVLITLTLVLRQSKTAIYHKIGITYP